MCPLNLRGIQILFTHFKLHGYFSNRDESSWPNVENNPIYHPTKDCHSIQINQQHDNLSVWNSNHALSNNSKIHKWIIIPVIIIMTKKTF